MVINFLAAELPTDHSFDTKWGQPNNLIIGHLAIHALDAGWVGVDPPTDNLLATHTSFIEVNLAIELPLAGY